MVSVILTDAAHKDIAAIDDSTLDLAFGSDENNFEFSFIDTCDAASRFTAGSFCYIDGTEYGGVVDSITTMKTHDGTMLSYTGRSWHGVLAEQVLQPDAGADYLTVNGTVQQVLQSCFDRIHLNNLFIADSNTTSIKDQFDRYTNAWNGIRKMLRASSLKLVLNYHDGKVHASTAPIEAYSDVVDSDIMDFTATRDWRPVNHLIGLGTGELRNRVVSHWYADSSGTVSQTQTLTGIDEVCEVYDYSNAASDELAKATQEKLQDLQSRGSVDVTINSTVTLDLDDVVTASDRVTGLTVTAQVTKKIVKISDGIMSVDYEVGKSSSTSGGLSGSAESSPGSVSYTAGAGITISSHVISADVTQADLDAVSAVANEANKTASDMSDSVGAILQSDSEQTTAIVKAQSTADAAKTAADSAQDTANAAQTAADDAKGAAVKASEVASIASQSGANLIVNGGFESGYTGWTTSGECIDATGDNYSKPRSGVNHARLGGGASISQTIPVVSGQRLRVAFWAAPSMGGRHVIGTIAFDGGAEQQVADLSVNNNNWILGTKDFVVPASATSMTLTIKASTTYSRVDDVSVTDVADAYEAKTTADEAQVSADMASRNAKNFIMNGDFINGMENWGNYSGAFEISPSDEIHGNVAHVTKVQAGGKSILAPISLLDVLGVSVNERLLRLEFDYYVNSLTVASGAYKFGFTSIFTNSGWQEMLANLSDAEPGEWHHYSEMRVVPAGGKLNSLYLLNRGQTEGDKVDYFVDNITITDVTDISFIQTTAEAAKKTADKASTDLTGFKTTVASTYTTKSEFTQTTDNIQSSVAANYSELSDRIDENKYVLPAATTSSLGGVKPDGKTITVAADGTLTAHSDSEAASFLAAYPIGSIYKTISHTNPGTTYGGTWVEVDSLDYFTYERTA